MIMKSFIDTYSGGRDTWLSLGAMKKIFTECCDDMRVDSDGFVVLHYGGHQVKLDMDTPLQSTETYRSISFARVVAVDKVSLGKYMFKAYNLLKEDEI